MKFAIAALLGLVAGNMQTEMVQDKVLLKDEMRSLLNLVHSVRAQDQQQIFDTIELRKDTLKGLAKSNPKRKIAIANEVQNLKHIVNAVLDEDYEQAVSELEARKEELVTIQQHLTVNEEDLTEMAKHSVFEAGENVFALKNGDDDAGSLKLTFSGVDEVVGVMVDAEGNEEDGYTG